MCGLGPSLLIPSTGSLSVFELPILKETQTIAVFVNVREPRRAHFFQSLNQTPKVFMFAKTVANAMHAPKFRFEM